MNTDPGVDAECETMQHKAGLFNIFGLVAENNTFNNLRYPETLKRYIDT